MFTAVPLITEFLASNDTVLDDEDGDSSDWIELYNAGDTALDLTGWHLTDDAGNLNQWMFPAVSLDPGAYLVVFASNKDRADADGTELHTNFAVGADGEYLALVEADGTTVAFEYAPTFPPQSEDISYGLAMNASITTLVDEGAAARYTVPTSSIAGWNTPGFNDSAWSEGPTGIGFENSPADYASLIETQVPNGTGSVYLRQTFNVADPNAFDTLSLGLRYDDGFVAYLNGVKVAESFAPASPQWNSFAVGAENHSDAQASEFEPFDLTPFLDELVVGNNVLAIQVMNDDGQSSDLLLEPVLTGSATTVDAGTQAYMVVPTPGAANFLAGPIIESVTKNPTPPAANQNLIIEASVVENAGNGLARVDLHYRINFDAEGSFQVFDNGVGADAVAGDGVFTGILSSGLYDAGDMVRWYVTAEDDAGQTARAPFFEDQTGNNQSAQYHGTIVTDPAVSTVLPVFTIFVEDPNAARTDAGTRASVFYDGEFYDNVYIRRRGFTTAGWNKRKFKIDFNKGDDFRYSNDAPRVTEINLQSHYLEVGGSPHTSYMREVLGFAFMQEVGVAASNAFHIHIEQNGGFFGLYSFVEQVDDTFLERNGFDPDGVLYKAAGSSSVGNLRPNPTESGYNIVQPDNGTFAELNDLTDGVNASNPDRWAYLFDRINLPALINEMAAHATIIHHDRLPKNYYMYLDPETQEWTRIPWDFDMPFAVGGLLTSENYNSPLYGDSEHNQGGSDIYNHLYDAILDNPETREMYLRRLRTLMDTYLDVSTGYFENLVNTLAAQIRPDAEADDLIWGAGDIDDGLNEILNISLPTRRDQLFNQYGPGGSGLIPGSQPTSPSLTIGTIEHTPAGDQDREYIQVVNNNGFAVDISGWTIEGGITHTFAAGTVIAAGSTLYITPSSSAFRARPTGPSGGQQLFVQQWDSGHLSSFGETITIKRLDGTTAATKSYTGDPTPEQEHLRVSELHYNPAGPTAAELAAGFTDGDQFEFIELINTSATETIDLAGVSLGTGVDTAFVGPTATLLSRGFGSGLGGFDFVDNAFNGTSEAGVASGTFDAAGGNGGGALRIDLLSSDASPAFGPASAAFTRDFTLAEAGEVTIELDYRFFYGGGFESNEIGQAIAEVDGIRLGSALNGALVSLTGDGNAGPPTDTGWQTIFVTLQLGAGTHTLSLGAYYSQSTFDNENVTAWYDNVNLTFSAAGPLPLAPGERALLVSDLAAFTQRYGQSVVDNAAAVVEYAGNLANGGEAVKLNDANGSTILDFTYEDGDDPGEEDWPTTPDGDGPSLVVLDTDGDYNDGNNWAASTTTHGTPGTGEAAGLVGDINADGYVDGLDLDLLFGFWGDAAASSPTADAADLNNDGTVNSPDLSLLLANFGTGTPPASQPTSNGDTPDDPDVDAGDGGGDAGGAGAGAVPGMGEGVGAGGGDAGAGEGLDAGDGAGPDAGADDVGAPDNMPDTPDTPDADRPRTPDFPGKSDPPAPDKPQPIDGLGPARHKRNAPDALALTRPITGQTTPDPKAVPDTRPPRRFDALKMR